MLVQTSGSIKRIKKIHPLPPASPFCFLDFNSHPSNEGCWYKIKVSNYKQFEDALNENNPTVSLLKNRNRFLLFVVANWPITNSHSGEWNAKICSWPTFLQLILCCLLLLPCRRLFLLKEPLHLPQTQHNDTTHLCPFITWLFEVTYHQNVNCLCGMTY